MKSLYDILGISRDANQKEIRRAYHKMALKYHPDKQEKRTDEATNLFLQIVDAFTVLSNETLRSDYDKNLELQEATENYRNQISKEKQDMIDELNLKEKEAQHGDPLQPYRDDLKTALKKMQPKAESHTFEEYERIILSSLLRSAA